jgi:hypothetical protein
VSSLSVALDRKSIYLRGLSREFALPDRNRIKDKSRLKICFWETGAPVRVRLRPPWWRSSPAGAVLPLVLMVYRWEHLMRAALWMIALFAGLGLPVPEAPAQKNEGLGVLSTSKSSSSSSDYRGSSSRGSRHSAPTRRRTTGTQDAGEGVKQGEPAAEQPSDKK